MPQGVEVHIEGSEVTVKGPKGELSRSLDPAMSVAVDDRAMVVSRPSDSRIHRSRHGLTRSLLSNMVVGVSEGFQKDLELVGVGYRAQKAGDKVILEVGYSHPVEFSAPSGVTVDVVAAQRLAVKGTDRELIGDVAAKIRAIRPPDHYKGKGIRYAGEVVRLKPGKSGKVGTKR